MRIFDSWRQQRRLKKELESCLVLPPTEVGSSFGFTDSQKCAIVLMSLPPELSARLFVDLGSFEVQMITLEITELPTLTQEMRAEVLTDVIERVEQRDSRSAEQQLEDMVENRKEQLLQIFREICENQQTEVFASLWDHHKLAVLMKHLSFFNRIKLTGRLAPRTFEYIQAAKDPVAWLAPAVEVRVLREFLGIDQECEVSAEVEVKMLGRTVSKLVRNRIDHVLDTVHLTWPKASVNPLYLERRAS